MCGKWAQTELAMGPMGSDGGQIDEVAQESLPDDLDQSPEFDPADPEPLPEDDFDQSRYPRCLTSEVR